MDLARVQPLFAEYRGSRANLVRAAAARVTSGLLLIFLGIRAFHLVQAAIDLSLGTTAFTHAALAMCLGGACVVESAAFAVAAGRRRRLTMPIASADACFGVAGLAVMSVATTQAPGRTGSLNWMLPFTVATAAGLAIAAVFGADPVRSDGRVARRLIVAGVGAAVLAAVFTASVTLPHRLTRDSVAQIVGDAANYPVFFLVATAFVLLLRRGVNVVAQRNEIAMRAAAAVAEQAQWRAVAVDVFGPVLALLDEAKQLEGEVPDSMRNEAAHLIDLIEAVNPLSGSDELGVR